MTQGSKDELREKIKHTLDMVELPKKSVENMTGALLDYATTYTAQREEEAYNRGYKKASEGAFKSQQDAKREARLNEVQNAYEDWINAEAGFHADYLRDRISELTKGEQDV